MPAAISCTFFNMRNEVLVFKHLRLGKWSIPVGRVEDGEGYIETMLREMWTGLGIEVITSLPVNKTQQIEDGFDYHVQHFVVLHCAGKLYNKEPDKHTDMQYMSKEDLLLLEVNKSTQTLLDNWDNYLAVYTQGKADA